MKMSWIEVVGMKRVVGVLRYVAEDVDVCRPRPRSNVSDSSVELSIVYPLDKIKGKFTSVSTPKDKPKNKHSTWSEISPLQRLYAFQQPGFRCITNYP